MGLSQALLVLKALMALIPWIVNLVRDGKIKVASQEEIVDAILANVTARVDAAKAARDSAVDDDPYAPSDSVHKRKN